jgi:hypothetical protein
MADEEDIFTAFETKLVVDDLLAMAPATEPPQEKKKHLPGIPGRTNPASFVLQQHAKSYTEEAFSVILEIMTDPDVDASTRLEAARQVLDRGWGKPAMKAEIQSKHVSIHATLGELASTINNPPKVSAMLTAEITDAQVIQEEDHAS